MRRTTTLVAVALGGCRSILGIEDTHLADAGDDAPDAEPPPALDVGDGSDGPLVVTGPLAVDDIRAAITDPASAGDRSIAIATGAAFAAGHEVLVIQMLGSGAGTHETVSVSAASDSALELSTPLAHEYASGAQVVRVPNFSEVTVAAGGVLTAAAWDPIAGTGGVVFFRARDGVTVAAGGAIALDQLGHRGGDGGNSIAGGGGGGPGSGGPGAANQPGGSRCDTQIQPQPGQPGASQPPAGGTGGGLSTFLGCVGAPGGTGGGIGMPGSAGDPGSAADGPGGGASGSGGSNATPSSARLVLGGGGGGGAGGASGHGGGGGGGGGGASSPCDPDTPVDGVTGDPGGQGGPGGAGGLGGTGGGLLVIHAASITIEGAIDLGGARGGNAGGGGEGGSGGAGGPGGRQCGSPLGGAGGGGDGAQGGTGGDGGGGGAGGTALLVSNATAIGDGLVTAGGGAGGGGGGPGGGGSGGTGNASGDTGAPGNGGDIGPVGEPGVILLVCPDECSGTSEPAAIVLTP